MDALRRKQVQRAVHLAGEPAEHHDLEQFVWVGDEGGEREVVSSCTYRRRLLAAQPCNRTGELGPVVPGDGREASQRLIVVGRLPSAIQLLEELRTCFERPKFLQRVRVGR